MIESPASAKYEHLSNYFGRASARPQNPSTPEPSFLSSHISSATTTSNKPSLAHNTTSIVYIEPFEVDSCTFLPRIQKSTKYMADTCIVCLGDLAGAEQSETGSSDVPDTKLELPASTTKIESKSPEITLPVHDQAGIIAHLLPCGHDLHHECLKPWVERASSCPLCRQSFNEVELKNNVYGTF